jgi:hypothetical protein
MVIKQKKKLTILCRKKIYNKIERYSSFFYLAKKPIVDFAF